MSFVNNLHQPLTNFLLFPCETEDIYLESLETGEMLVSYQPFMILNTNGIVIGLNDSFHQFYHLDKDKHILKIIELNWISDCQITEEVVMPALAPKYEATLTWLFPILFISLSIGVFYVRKNR